MKYYDTSKKGKSNIRTPSTACADTLFLDLLNLAGVGLIPPKNTIDLVGFGRFWWVFFRIYTRLCWFYCSFHVRISLTKRL